MLTATQKFALLLQSFLGRMTFPFWGVLFALLLRYRARYRIVNLSEVRHKYRELCKSKQPFFICSNHLTLIDSAILLWAFADLPWYFWNFSKFSWNVPAVENFKNTWLSSLVTYLGQCIAIDRQGAKEHHDEVLSQLSWLIATGHPVTVFPEGGRSRTGRIEPQDIAYGVGQITESANLLRKSGNEGNVRVLCVYLRGDKQTTYSDYPASGSKFRILMSEITPAPIETGRRAHRQISLQIAMELKRLEDQYFES